MIDRLAIALAAALALVAASQAPAFWQSRDSNFNIVAGGGTPPPPTSYTPQGVSFSANAWAKKTTALGVTDGVSGLASFWIKITSAAGSQRTILNTGNSAALSGFTLYASASTGPRCNGWNAASVQVLRVADLLDTVTGATAWSHVLCSWNAATGRGHVYFNDIDRTDTASLLLNNTNTLFNGASPVVGADSTGTSSLYGNNVADVQVWFNVDVDLATTANRRLFLTAGGGAVNPATAAASSLGTPHILLCSSAASGICAGNVSGWISNKGSTGGFTLQAGSISAAADNPPGS